jgi:hypothetical protein
VVIKASGKIAELEALAREELAQRQVWDCMGGLGSGREGR